MPEIKSYQDAVEYLTKIVDLLNKDFFGGELPKCQVTIQSRRGSYAHYTVSEVWRESDNGYHELNLAAEYLTRPIAEVIASCQHELIHHYNYIHGIKDCSGSMNFYHNKNFKETAERHGLIIDKDAKYGWTITSPGEELYDFVKNYDLTDIKINRQYLKQLNSDDDGNNTGKGAKAPKRKQSSIKWVCPECGFIIRTTRPDTYVYCGCSMKKFVRAIDD